MYNSVQEPTQPEALVGNNQPQIESRPEDKPVVYAMPELSIDQQWIALEYARALDAKVESHDVQRAFIMRANEGTHERINDFLKNLQNSDYQKNIECVETLWSKKLRTHSDNHPAVVQLRNLYKQLVRVDQEYREFLGQAPNEELFPRIEKWRFYADDGDKVERQSVELKERSDETAEDAELAQATEAPIAPQGDVESKAKTITITEPETIVEIQRDEIRLLKFPGEIARADMRYREAIEVEPVTGQVETLRIRGRLDGSCALLVTTANDTVYAVHVKVGQGRAQFRDLELTDEKVVDALGTQVTLEFPDNSLSEISGFVAALHNIPMVIDDQDLKAAGTTPDLHVTMIATNLTLAQALTTMVEKVKEPPLDWYVDGGAIHVSTVAAMQKRERLEFYNLLSLSPESQKAAVEYITPLAKSVDNLEGSLGVDASLSVHKRFEEFLRGASQQDSKRPARAIPLKPVTPKISPEATEPNPP